MTATDIKSKWISKMEHGTPADEAVKCAVDETVTNYKIIEVNNVVLVKKNDALISRIAAEKNTHPITAEFLKVNFKLSFASKTNARYETTPDQTSISVDVFFRESDGATVVVYGEPRDNVVNVKTVGQLISFLNLCGLGDFAKTLKI